jgi:hypothetical protein
VQKSSQVMLSDLPRWQCRHHFKPVPHFNARLTVAVKPSKFKALSPLTLKIWDHDSVSRDDLISTCTLDVTDERFDSFEPIALQCEPSSPDSGEVEAELVVEFGLDND